jgi:hypothetical protein
MEDEFGRGFHRLEMQILRRIGIILVAFVSAVFGYGICLGQYKETMTRMNQVWQLCWKNAHAIARIEGILERNQGKPCKTQLTSIRGALADYPAHNAKPSSY